MSSHKHERFLARRLRIGLLALLVAGLVCSPLTFGAAGDLDPNFDGDEHFIDGEGYADPLATDPTAKYWGAFEPVRYEVGDVPAGAGPTDRVGWVVLVQKRALR